MKLETTVSKLTELFKKIKKQPEQLFEMIRTNIRETVGRYLTAMMDAELTQFFGSSLTFGERYTTSTHDRQTYTSRNFCCTVGL